MICKESGKVERLGFVGVVGDVATSDGGSNYAWAGVLTFAGTAALADGPLPIGDAIGAGVVASYGIYVGAKAAADYMKKSGVQYTLRAKTSGYYPVYSYGWRNSTGTQYLNAGDIWKIGQTTQYNFVTGNQYRYSDAQLRAWGVSFLPEFPGTRVEIMMVEKMKIWNYIHTNDALPPGNKVPW